MATVKSFEDLEVWKRSRTFSNKVYEITLQGSFVRDYSLRDQINKSSGSVMDNIAEGFERGGNKEFILFLSYSKGSIGESRSQLFRALDRKHVDEKCFNELTEEAIIIGKMLGSLMSYLQRSDFKGSKFHEPDAFYQANLESGTLNPESEESES